MRARTHKDVIVIAARAQAGFSMLELMVVLVIAVSVTALSLPSLTGMLLTAKLRAGMGDLASIMQNCRSMAVKTNRYKFVHFQTSGGGQVAYVDDATNPGGLSGTPSPPQLWLPSEFTKVSEPSGSDGAPQALSNDQCGASSTATIDTSDDPYFNQLGVPCKYVSETNCTSGTAFAFYFNYAGSLGGTRWAATCISPAGRIKNWFWSGSEWKN